MDTPRRKPREIDPRAVDVAAFARSGARLEGQWPLAALGRLRTLVLDDADGDADADADGDAARVTWSASGSTRAVRGGEPELWLELEAAVPVRLQCQRCLQPMGQVLAVDRRLRFVRGEDEAARLDEELEDDVLALLPRHDLRDLVEDELILALPLVPLHASCPEPLPGVGSEAAAADGQPADADREAEAAAEHPFATLAALRRGSS